MLCGSRTCGWVKKAWRVFDSIGEKADLVPYAVVWRVAGIVQMGILPHLGGLGTFLRLLSFTLFMYIATCAGTAVVSLFLRYFCWAFRSLLSPPIYLAYKYFSYALFCNHSDFMPTYCPIMLLSFTIFLLYLTLQYWSTSGYISNLDTCKKKPSLDDRQHEGIRVWKKLGGGTGTCLREKHVIMWCRDSMCATHSLLGSIYTPGSCLGFCVQGLFSEFCQLSLLIPPSSLTEMDKSSPLWVDSPPQPYKWRPEQSNTQGFSVFHSKPGKAALSSPVGT